MKKLKLVVLSLLVFILFSMFSQEPTRIGDFYNYNFGLFDFLEIRRNSNIEGNLNIFNVINSCDNFSLNILSLLAGIFVTIVFSYGLIKATEYIISIFHRKNVNNQN